MNATDLLDVLGVGAAHGDDHAAALLELLHQGFGHLGRRRPHVDRVVGREGRVALPAVPRYGGENNFKIFLFLIVKKKFRYFFFF